MASAALIGQNAFDREEKHHVSRSSGRFAIDIASNIGGNGGGTMTKQVLLRLPEELALRFKRQVPTRGRSAFVQRLLEQALALEGGDDDPLYRAAQEVEQDERLMAEMADWDSTVADGLEVEPFGAQSS